MAHLKSFTTMGLQLIGFNVVGGINDDNWHDHALKHCELSHIVLHPIKTPICTFALAVVFGATLRNIGMKT